jgi:hypothetical protein
MFAGSCKTKGPAIQRALSSNRNQTALGGMQRFINVAVVIRALESASSAISSYGSVFLAKPHSLSDVVQTVRDFRSSGSR